MARVWANSQRKDGELLVMLALADFSNDAGESWPSIPVLAQKARLTERQTRRVIIKLEDVGEVRKVLSNGGRNRRNHYFITVQENPDKITLTKLQGKNNSVIGDTKTLVHMSGALNHHRTINKNTRAEVRELVSNKRIGTPKQFDPVQERAFAAWYHAYPRHVGQKPARLAWLKLNPDPALVDTIMIATARYAESKAGVEFRFIAHPVTWLNGERWTDETLPAGHNGTLPFSTGTPAARPRGLQEIPRP